MQRLCGIFSCCRASDASEDNDLEEILSPEVEDGIRWNNLQFVFMNYLIDERDSCIAMVKNTIAPLHKDLDEKYNQLLRLKEDSIRALRVECKDLSLKEVYLNVIVIVMGVVSFYANELHNLFERESCLIKEKYESQGHFIIASVKELMAQRDSEILPFLERNADDYFIRNFSYKTPYQMKQDVKELLVFAESRVVEKCFFDCFHQEKAMWGRFILGKFRILDKYRERYATTAAFSLGRAVYQICDSLDTRVTLLDALIRDLLLFKECDSKRLEIALQKSWARVIIRQEKNKVHLMEHVRRLTKKELVLDLHEMEENIYNYFKNLLSLLNNSYESLPLNESKVAITSMDDFVSKKLVDIKRTTPTIRKCDSEILLSGISQDAWEKRLENTTRSSEF